MRGGYQVIHANDYYEYKYACADFIILKGENWTVVYASTIAMKLMTRYFFQLKLKWEASYFKD